MSAPLRVFFVAGESSGDLHGANLIRALRASRPDIVCEGIGGTRMAAAGMTLHHDLASQAIMGFVEVVKHLGMIRRLFHETLARLRETRPDCLVLIDYPGFNLRLAAAVWPLRIPVVYYISPQVWAWKKNRIHSLKRFCRRMLVILPFEKPLYDAVGLDCVFVGHPLQDALPQVPLEGRYAGTCTIGLLPGSRAQEISRILPEMLAVAEGIRRAHPEARFVAPCVDAARADQVRTIAARCGFPIEVDIGGAYEVLSAARFCMVASGTATVETMLFECPMVVMYRVAPVTYWLARLVVRVEHIGLVNILAGKRIVPEFVQHEATADRILPIARDLIADGPVREQMLADLRAVKATLGGPGASACAAEAVLAVADEHRRLALPAPDAPTQGPGENPAPMEQTHRHG